MEELIVGNAIRWIGWLLFSLYFGGRAAEKIIDLIRKNYKKRAPVNDSDLKCFGEFFAKPGLEQSIGYVERFFFTICVAFNLSGLVVAVITWVVLKMLYIWAPKFKSLEKLQDSVEDNEIEKKRKLFSEYAMSSVLGSMVSIIFAIIAGLFIRYGWGVFEPPV